jgi:hypothetical protein
MPAAVIELERAIGEGAERGGGHGPIFEMFELRASAAELALTGHRSSAHRLAEQTLK